MGRLIVDMTRCEGRGICIVVAPDVVDLDRFGFPVVVGDLTDAAAERLALQAVRACPNQALSFIEDEHPRGHHSGGV